MGELIPLIQPKVSDAQDIFEFVRTMLGWPVVEVELDDNQLELFLDNSLECFSRLNPKIRWFSMPAYAGVQRYVPPADTVGFGVVDVMIPRIDPIAPLLLSCLAEDTEIDVVGKEVVTIKKLLDMYGSGEFWVYAFEGGGKGVVPARAHDLQLARENADVVKVTIVDSNEQTTKVTCTSDHRFMLANGQYKEANILEVGDLLMAVRPRPDQEFRVQSVNKSGKRDVYDLAVDTYENFAISPGVFVHNSGPRLDVFAYRYSYPYRHLSELYIDMAFFAEAQKLLSSAFDWEVIDGAIMVHPKPDEPFTLSYASAFPYDVETLPPSEIDWLKKHVLAQAEIALGRIRRKFQLPGAHSAQVLDGGQLVQEGMARMQQAEQELLLRIPPLPVMRTS